MTALELLTTLRELGVTLTLWVDRLHVDAPQGATGPRWGALPRGRRHKAVCFSSPPTTVGLSGSHLKAYARFLLGA
jgi:hypothetical protein